MAVGVAFILIGVLNICSRRFYRVTTVNKKPAHDINIFSPRQRYLLSRYDAGFKFVAIGAVLIVLAWALLSL